MFLVFCPREEDRAAARKAMQYLAARDSASPMDILNLGLARYFDCPAVLCPSVNAAETLLAVLHEGPLLLDHFLETSDPAKLLSLIDVNLPLRASARNQPHVRQQVLLTLLLLFSVTCR